MRFELLRNGALAVSVATIVGVFSGCMRSPEARGAKYMEAGKKDLEKKDNRRAVLDFRNAVQLNPRNAEAFYQLSQAYLATGDIPNGVNTLRKALELNPNHRAARLRMAELMSYSLDSGHVKEAQERLKGILDESPSDVDALHALALTELKLNDTASAMEHLERALQSAPQRVMIAAALADAKLREKDTKGAEEVLKEAAVHSPKSPDPMVLLARFYTIQQQTSEAEQEYQRALALDGTHPAALSELAALELRTGRKMEAEQIFKRMASLPDKTINYSYAMFLFQEGRRDEAVRECERLWKRDPEDRSARTRLVAAYQAVNRLDLAAKTLDEALKKDPKDLDALLQRGELSLSGRKYDQAESDLNEVLRFQPNSAEVYYVLAKLQKERGAELTYRQNLTKALQFNPYLLSVRVELAQALTTAKSPKAALDLLNEAPESQRQSVPVLVQRNWALWALGDMAEMRKGIDVGLAGQKNADLLIQDGLWKLRAGDFGRARAAVEAALALDPSNVQALGVLRVSYTSQKQDAAAVQKVKEYASKQPNSAPVQDFLGKTLLVSGDRLQARAAFEAALADDPKSVDANLSLVQLDLVERKNDDAQRRLEKVLSSDPTNTTARWWLANLVLSKGDVKLAIEQFRQVLASDPNNAEVLNNLAYLLAETGAQTAEALKYAQKAKELAPESLQYSDTLGWILYRQGLYPLAVQELQRATAKGGDPIWKYHLAMAYAKTGDLARGRATLTAALKQNPKLPEAKMAQDLLATGQKAGKAD